MLTSSPSDATRYPLCFLVPPICTIRRTPPPLYWSFFTHRHHACPQRPPLAPHSRQRRQRRLITSSASSDNTDDTSANEDSIAKDVFRSSDENTSENTLRPQSNAHHDTRQNAIDPVVLKQKVLSALSKFTDGGSQRQDLEALIVSLESLQNIPATEAFTEVALAGDWNLLFSSINMRPGGNVRIREIGQVFDTEKKTLTNKALWSFTGADNVQQIRAHLYVTASYFLQSPGRLQVQLVDHKIKTLPQEDGSDNLMPDDLHDLIRQLQRALPIEFFDPTGIIDVTYIEPQFRLAKITGKKVAGVRNVFVRRDKAGTATAKS